MSLTPQALRLLSKEIVSLRNDPLEGVRVVVDEEDLTAMEGWVQGPSGTPYEGGYFRVKFQFGPDYPNLPPKCTMITRIFHPNVSKAGEICVDTLKKGWDKKFGIGHVLVTIKCLLIYPNPESALDEEAGKQLLADYEGYSKYARLMTSIHATPKVIPAPFRDTPSSSKISPSSTSLPITHSTSTSASSNPTTSMRAPTSIGTSSTTSASTGTSATAGPGSKPTPLQAHAKQEQSPIIDNGGKLDDGDKIVKPAQTPGSGAGAGTGGGKTNAKTAAATKAKRALKRL